MLLERLLAAAATLSATGRASPRPDRTSWLGVRLTSFVTLTRARELFLNSQCRRDAARAAAGGGRDALSYRESVAKTRSHQLARGAFNLLCHPHTRARAFPKFSVPARCCSSGCWRRPRRSQLPGERRQDPIAPAG